MSESRRTIDREELLAQLTWVRSLARSLVADPGVAEDLAQETWIAATTRPPVSTDGSRLGGRELRAWLSAVVANLARKSVRTRRRRSAREELAAAPEPADDPSEVVARAALHTELAGRVLALEEPYRSAILLRYFDGLSSQELSLRLGISDVAARKRVSRGLALLRDDLDRAHGDRASWLSLFAVDLARLQRGAAGSTPSAVTLGAAPGLVIAMKVIGVIVSVVLLAIGVGTWSRGDAREELERSALVSHEERTSANVGTPIDSAVAPSAARALVADGVRRELVVTDEIGVSQAGVEALALRRGELVARATTDAAGRVEFLGHDGIDAYVVVPPHGRWVEVEARADEPTTHARLGEGGVVAGRLRGPVENEHFVLELHDDRIDERLRDLRPSVASALVDLGVIGVRRRLVVDARGAFELSGLPLDWSGCLVVPRTWTLANTGGKGELLDGTTLHLVEPLDGLELALAAPALVRGRVVDAANGAPIAGVLVRTTNADDVDRIDRLEQATSGTDGRFALNVVADPNGVVALDLWAFGGRVRSTLRVVPAETLDGDGVVAELDVGRTLEILVHDADGRPVSGATARLCERSSTLPSTPSSSDGRIVFEGVAANDTLLAIDAIGYESVRVPVPEDDSLEVRLAAAATVRFVLVREDGVPVAARRLALESQGGGAGVMSFDGAGERVLGPLPHGEALVAHLVDLIGGRGATVDVHTPSIAGERRIELAAALPTVHVTGRVVDERGRPLPRATIAIEGESGSIDTTSDADGAFDVPALFATGGTASLEVTRAGRVPFTVDEFTVDTGLAPFHVVLERGRRVEVHVLDHAGQPFDVGLVLARFDDDDGDLAESSGLGVHVFANLKERRGVVYTLLGGREIAVPVEPHDTQLELVLPPLGRLRARLPLDLDESGVRTCLVIEPQGGGELMRTYVPLDHPRDQPFELDLPVGSYRIGAERRTLAKRKVEALGEKQALTIAAGATVDVTWP
jgi:RNA polymerase sigma factor (sigma-70 family)